MNNFSSTALDIAPAWLYIYPQSVVALGENQHDAFQLQPRNQAYGSLHRKVQPPSPTTAWRRGCSLGGDEMRSKHRMDDGGRECTQCHKYQPWENFCRHKPSPFGRYAICKTCRSLSRKRPKQSRHRIDKHGRECCECRQFLPWSMYCKRIIGINQKSSICKKCAAKRGAEHRKLNPQKHKEYRKRSWQKTKDSEAYKKYLEENREKILARHRRYNEEHREEKREWYYDNHEERLEYCRQYRTTETYAVSQHKYQQKPSSIKMHQERSKTPAALLRKRMYYITPRGKAIVIANTRKRRARLKNLPGWNYTTPQHIQDRVEMFGGLCYICQKPYEAIDHVIAVNNHGTHFPSNLRPACKSCNSSKGDKPLVDWLKRRQLLATL